MPGVCLLYAEKEKMVSIFQCPMDIFTEKSLNLSVGNPKNAEQNLTNNILL